MLRQIQVNGKSFELISLDGRFWASSPKVLIQLKKRRQYLSNQCKAGPNDLKTCRAMDMIQEPEPTAEISSRSSYLPFFGRTQRR